MVWKKEKNQINFFWISKRKGEISGQIRKVILIEREISDEKWINEKIEIFYIKKCRKDFYWTHKWASLKNTSFFNNT